MPRPLSLQTLAGPGLDFSRWHAGHPCCGFLRAPGAAAVSPCLISRVATVVSGFSCRSQAASQRCRSSLMGSPVQSLCSQSGDLSESAAARAVDGASVMIISKLKSPIRDCCSFGIAEVVAISQGLCVLNASWIVGSSGMPGISLPLEAGRKGDALWIL